MILCDTTLQTYLDNGTLVVDPISEHAIQPGSIDCRLGNHFLMLEDMNMDIIRLDGKPQYREIIDEEITIPPRTFLLATTMEYFELPHDVTGMVEGRSSVGRMGLFIQNAGLIDAGWKGKITLELFNANSLPIKLQAGRRICQLVCYQMDSPAARPYQGKYQNQQTTIGSRIFEDEEVIKRP